MPKAAVLCSAPALREVTGASCNACREGLEPGFCAVCIVSEHCCSAAGIRGIAGRCFLESISAALDRATEGRIDCMRTFAWSMASVRPSPVLSEPRRTHEQAFCYNADNAGQEKSAVLFVEAQYGLHGRRIRVSRLDRAPRGTVSPAWLSGGDPGVPTNERLDSADIRQSRQRASCVPHRRTSGNLEFRRQNFHGPLF